jgi:hypothetical protein
VVAIQLTAPCWAAQQLSGRGHVAICSLPSILPLGSLLAIILPITSFGPDDDCYSALNPAPSTQYLECVPGHRAHPAHCTSG